MIKPAVSRTGPVDTLHSPYALWKTLGRHEIRLAPGFWTEKQAVNRTVSLRHAYEMLEKNGNLHNLRLAAGQATGAYQGRNFLDSDIYKWLEAVAWELGNAADPDLQRMADEAIGLIMAAQREDGYLNSYVQVTGLKAPFEDLDHGHELYCAGHLFQAAVAFQRARRDARLLEVAGRFADHICRMFGPGRRQGACGHPVIEMALIELYRVTGKTSYLEMAAFFINFRGQRQMSGYGPYGPEYMQDHLPVREVREAVGHTVPQLYLASGVTDLELETGEPALFQGMQRLSQDIAGTKLYITGAMGSRFDGEAFGDPYELPPDQCYGETCTAIAGLMWNWRMLLASGESFYADQMEQALYNNILASPALDGRHFFYINPLQLREPRFLRLSSNPPPQEGFVPTERPEWHDVACCPPNVMRLLASIESYLATRSANGLQIHHYAPADLEVALEDGSRLGLRMETGYPWQGQVRLEVTHTSQAPWSISLRLPRWSPGFRLTLNGQAPDDLHSAQGYISLERAWQVGDILELDLEMEPVLIAANPRVDAVRTNLAIQRGPLVYCLEDCDQEIQGRLLDTVIDPGTALKPVWRADLLGGVMVVETAGSVRSNQDWQGTLYARVDGNRAAPGDAEGRRVRLVAIPYFAWGNRGIGAMRVWIPIH